MDRACNPITKTHTSKLHTQCPPAATTAAVPHTPARGCAALQRTLVDARADPRCARFREDGLQSLCHSTRAADEAWTTEREIAQETRLSNTTRHARATRHTPHATHPYAAHPYALRLAPQSSKPVRGDKLKDGQMPAKAHLLEHLTGEIFRHAQGAREVVRSHEYAVDSGHLDPRAGTAGSGDCHFLSHTVGIWQNRNAYSAVSTAWLVCVFTGIGGGQQTATRHPLSDDPVRARCVTKLTDARVAGLGEEAGATLCHTWRPSRDVFIGGRPAPGTASIFSMSRMAARDSMLSTSATCALRSLMKAAVFGFSFSKHAKSVMASS